MEQMEALAKTLADANDKYLRLAAEYDNYRKRTAREKEHLYNDAKIDTIKPFLAVLDNLEGRTRLYWTVTGGAGMLRQSGDSKTAAEEYSEALREKLFSYLDG